MDKVLFGSLDEGSSEGLRLELAELRASRARVAAAADADRRRIERDLHDGAQQQLIALAVNLQLARALADSDPRALKTLLEEIRRDVHDALEDVRRLATRIYPPFLLERGLVETLQAAAADALIPTRVEAPAAERYSPEIEATVYFCCLETLQQAAEHAGAGDGATIRVCQFEDALRFDVVVARAGADEWPTEEDLASIGDRLGAVGGSLVVSVDDDAGICVSGTIALDRG